jgi:hypothetical protein
LMLAILGGLADVERHPYRRRQKPRQGPGPADGPTPFPYPGTTERGQQTARARRYA